MMIEAIVLTTASCIALYSIWTSIRANKTLREAERTLEAADKSLETARRNYEGCSRIWEAVIDAGRKDDS